MLDSVLMAFSLYSRIPVPQAKWNEKSMRWCICFLPLVGAVIGLIQWAAYMLLGSLVLMSKLISMMIVAAVGLITIRIGLLDELHDLLHLRG